MPHRLDAQVSGGFAGEYLIGGIDRHVDRGKQRELLTGAATRECRLRRSHSAGVEPDDVEVCDEFFSEHSVWNVADKLQTAGARTAGIHE